MHPHPDLQRDVIRFSSCGVPEGAVMEYMYDYCCLAAARMHGDMCGSLPPAIDLEVLPLENVALGRGTIRGLSLARTTALMSTDSIDSVLLSLSSSTFHYRSRQDPDPTPVHPGELLVSSYGSPKQLFWNQTNHVRSLQLDRKRLSRLLPGFDPETTHRITVDHRTSLLFRYVDILFDDDLRDSSLLGAAADHLFDLTALALGTTGDYAEHARERGVRAARLASIKEELRQRFGEPDLSVGELAHRHGISVRYLQTLFEQEGTTYSGFLAQQRLEFAAKRLRDVRYRHLRVADIAFDAGYSDLTAFNRAFRKFHGETPTQMRVG